jgi:hypothetical protein
MLISRSGAPQSGQDGDVPEVGGHCDGIQRDGGFGWRAGEVERVIGRSDDERDDGFKCWWAMPSGADFVVVLLSVAGALHRMSFGHPPRLAPGKTVVPVRYRSGQLHEHRLQLYHEISPRDPSAIAVAILVSWMTQHLAPTYEVNAMTARNEWCCKSQPALLPCVWEQRYMHGEQRDGKHGTCGNMNEK